MKTALVPSNVGQIVTCVRLATAREIRRNNLRSGVYWRIKERLTTTKGDQVPYVDDAQIEPSPIAPMKPALGGVAKRAFTAMTCEEIAAELGIPRKAVQDAEASAIAKVRDFFQRRGIQAPDLFTS